MWRDSGLGETGKMTDLGNEVCLAVPCGAVTRGGMTSHLLLCPL